jgi:hypothetical protein
MTNPGISSGPAELEGSRLLIALRTSASEIRARNMNPESCESGGMSRGQWLLYGDGQCLTKTSATTLGSTKCSPSISG